MASGKRPPKKPPGGAHKGKRRATRRDRGERDERPRGKKHRGGPRQPDRQPAPGAIPEVAVLIIEGENEEGDLLATPAKWEGRHAPPHIVVIDTGRPPGAQTGDRVLARMRKVEKHLYQALVIRVLPEEAPKQVVGMFMPTSDGGIIEPISRKMKESFLVSREDTLGAQRGELVLAATLAGVPSLSMRYAKITERLGSADAPRAASLIATQLHDLPTQFPKEALAEAEIAPPPVMIPGREDLRGIPLVTIDGEDARDFDDAVFAERWMDGWHILVAIADVAHYVTEGSALDEEAVTRGNSVYFPDRVIPMLPERLSNGLCSLNPDEDRYCLAVHIWLDAQGNMKRYEFVRGLMRSRARLTYTIAQDAYNSKKHELYESIIAPLYGAYAVLAAERDRRGALDLNLPEYKVLFDRNGEVAAIAPRERLESHRLIETYMIAANVAAADYLLKKNLPAIYRVHETPDEDKVEELGNMLKLAGYGLHHGAGLKAAHFNRVLHQVAGKPEEYLVNTAILRSQMQAYYSPECLGHFGLSLQKYCHFTSPIRRYSDLVVHRALAAAITGGKVKHGRGHRSLEEIALHISDTERRAMLAERDATDRYKIAYMAKHVGGAFSGVITSLNEHGLFINLNDTGVTGFMPVRNLPGDFFLYDKKLAAFKGQRTRQLFQLGQPLIIRVQAANAVTGSLVFELAAPSAGEQRGHHASTSRRQQQKEHHFHNPPAKPAWMKKGKRAPRDGEGERGERHPKPEWKERERDTGRDGRPAWQRDREDGESRPGKPWEKRPRRGGSGGGERSESAPRKGKPGGGRKPPRGKR